LKHRSNRGSWDTFWTQGQIAQRKALRETAAKRQERYSQRFSTPPDDEKALRASVQSTRGQLAKSIEQQ
jgi:hypothetical protein